MNITFPSGSTLTAPAKFEAGLLTVRNKGGHNVYEAAQDHDGNVTVTKFIEWKANV